VFEPAKEIEMNFTVKNPEKFYKKINELIRTVFNVPDAYVQEKEYSWEKGKGKEKFDISWEVNKILDIYSYIVVEIDLKGSAAEGEGKVRVRLKPRLITEYPQDTLWQQSIFYEMLRRFWHKFYYHKKRMEYLDLAKETLINFESSIKRFAETQR
jgi:hypothetical protein